MYWSTDWRQNVCVYHKWVLKEEQNTVLRLVIACMCVHQKWAFTVAIHSFKICCIGVDKNSLLLVQKHVECFHPSVYSITFIQKIYNVWKNRVLMPTRIKSTWWKIFEKYKQHFHYFVTNFNNIKLHVCNKNMKQWLRKYVEKWVGKTGTRLRGVYFIISPVFFFLYLI